jgi:hypothetical protein
LLLGISQSYTFSKSRKSGSNIFPINL